MAKKNSQKDTSGVVFDTRSKMAMSQGGTTERMKEKISAVRAVVPNKSNNEIVLVLQHFENCVDRAVQAFIEGSAVDILKEWNVTGKKKPKKKKKPKPQPEAVEPGRPVAPEEDEKKEELNGFHGNGSVLDGESLDSLSEQLDSASLDAAELDSEPAAAETPGAEAEIVCSAPPPPSQQGGRNLHQPPRGNKNRHRTGSGSHPPASSFPPHSEEQGAGVRKMAPNIDRSMKDLQRCTASLTRYKVVVKEEMDSSIKTMKTTFAELQSCLMDREVTLLGEMDKVKAEAMMILGARQKKAEELRRLTDQSASMSEEQLTELRADIKHFVSERKYDEDLGKALRFTFDLEPLKATITGFGSVYHPNTGYSNRSRCSSTSSVASPPFGETPPSQTTSPPNDHRPPPNKQIFQGNRRTFQGQGYHSGAQRYNGASYHDRNFTRANHRQHQSDGAPPGPSQPPHRGPAPSSTSSNGLPQRTPRTMTLEEKEKREKAQSKPIY
ncbi:LOW QUALITY PROTEIN: spermatogenesis-associated serine-rich protein 2 [Gymnodraco acuticeps]|uniref:LOW QUALITY PROTEIN: spermatogenesis-associated serine-rich protein 2 n=1 Tax=Gymnodraco acuticeps TaxID=8218 RepID=A0A6P8VNC3_GYMAC|nr:LOW QUALITY PROTEIN: spermatogenesis-associated serine-rich protein 2 [Gymnodraco acuticeps]